MTVGNRGRDRARRGLRCAKNSVRTMVATALLDRISVKRAVQGVQLWMPLSHKLPYYTHLFPDYGQNLVELVDEMSRESPYRFQILDVGANIGDSALQVLMRARVDVTCLEGDPFWQRYLRRNVGDRPDVQVIDAILSASPLDRALALRRADGTTQMLPGSRAMTRRHDLLMVADLADHLTLQSPVRLLKSDTDGWDTSLIPALAEAFAATTPVLFFEFDPRLAEMTGSPTRSFWAELESRGYDLCVVWDNFGRLLGVADTRLLHARERLPIGAGADSFYWDVGAAHRDDPVGIRCLKALVERAGHPRLAW